MSKNQKLTGVIIDGVVYNIVVYNTTEANSNFLGNICKECALFNFCTKNSCFCDFCKHYLKGNEYFKKEQKDYDEVEYLDVY